MAKNGILYVKKMDLSESEDEDEEEDIWDDRKLNDAYDKALSIANAEVAKRLAMSTNTQNKKDDSTSKDKSHSTSTKTCKKENKIQWKTGMHCRAVYEVDGIEYEASLMRIINDKECVVRFLGYENSEIVPINSLKPTLGKTERTRQIEEALAENIEEGYSNNLHCENTECSDRLTSPGSSVSQKKKKKSAKKKNKPNQMNGFDLPELPPLPTPNFAHLKNIGAMDMPIPPPPPINLTRTDVESEEQAVSSMLLSWYMSGYYTGLYQGMKRSREGRKN